MNPRISLGTFTGDVPGPLTRDDTAPLGYAYTADFQFAGFANPFLKTNKPYRVGLEEREFEVTTDTETGATLNVHWSETPETWNGSQTSAERWVTANTAPG